MTDEAKEESGGINFNAPVDMGGGDIVAGNKGDEVHGNKGNTIEGDVAGDANMSYTEASSPMDKVEDFFLAMAALQYESSDEQQSVSERSDAIGKEEDDPETIRPALLLSDLNMIHEKQVELGKEESETLVSRCVDCVKRFCTSPECVKLGQIALASMKAAATVSPPLAILTAALETALPKK